MGRACGRCQDRHMTDRHSFNYIESDIPEHMTLADWRRRNCPAEPRTTRRFGFRRLLGR